ncbi:unnamed protein product [Brachionus calyciflorus]|uniref:EGF-like domain-containing protein n=1 Tax=Brachionus calyciflorus TaxID=104777 RepID=A0A813RCC4_9BILA|nr:unnamed protein product [Brachionus calyciflorus]
MKNKFFFNSLIITLVSITLTNCQSLNPCVNSHCKNFAKCIPINEYNYTCQCNSIYWRGKYCDEPTDKNLCFSSPCRMGSTCLYDDIYNSYKCLCQTGYTGLNCDEIIDTCQSYPCKNRGLCSNISPIGIREPNYYRCSCQPGYTGKNCEIIIDQCASNPCLNFGICISRIDKYECICLPSYNGTRCENDFSLNSYTCSCRDGFFGNKCEIELNQCAQVVNPCNNNGICQSTPSFGLPYTCYCLPGFTGKKCEIKVDLCAENPCKFGGICSMPTSFTYKCDCPKGTIGINCEVNYDECQSQPCKNNGTCIETSLNSYSCLCPDRYTGVNCEIFSQECLPDTCKNGGLCLNTLNGPLCLCFDGFTGPFCETSLSACNSAPCQNNGTCVRTFNNTYKCACRVPFTGLNCETKYNLCSIYNPCLNSGVCESNGTVTKCTCPTGFTGKYCEIRLSICETNPCNSNGKCYEENNGTFKCFCNRGYTGKNCSSIINTCLSNPCKNGAQCESLVNDFKCVCPIGYTSKRCEVELNPCDSNPCFNDGICYNSFNYYNCSCSPDFSGKNCEISLDPCIFMNNCSNNGRCENRFGIGLCKCNQPFYGEYCQFSIDYCLSRPCQNAGRCQSNSTSYSCTCTVGFTGENCENVIDPCENYCQNNGTCFMDAKLMIGCQCPCDYQGLRCENKINFCNTSSLCKNGKCIENGCGYKCSCDCGFTGKYCDIPINQCEPDRNGTPKCLNNGICISNGCNYTCNCTQGFTGNMCQIKKPMCTLNTCQNGGICSDNINDYTCTCPCKYYTGKNCEIYQDICSERGSECLNGGACVSKGCDFQCVCNGSFTGDRCEIKQDPCLKNPCFNNGTCVSDPNTNNFRCICNGHYTGVDCSKLIDSKNSVCSSSPCGNFKLCFEKNSTYYTCECPPLYTGDRCDVRIRACLNSPCNGGQCIEDLTNGFKCICPIGFTGKQCEILINTCSSQPCLNNATCTQSRPNTFKCVCPPGLTGTLCQSKINPCLSFPCLNNGICSSHANDPAKWSCNCTSSCHTGSRCELEINPCLNNTCNNRGSCINLGSCKSKCICESGWTGVNCEVQLDICQSQPCVNNGTCVNNGNSWSCKCPLGLTGARCTNYALSCTSSPCENGGLCIESLNSYSYTCKCPSGWTGNSCEIDLNECEKNPCLNGGTCIEDKIDSFKCICHKAYSGSLCEDQIDLCLSQPCLNSATCVSNSNGTFTCQCESGFYGSRCEYEANECSSNPCLNNGICMDKINGYECRCPNEFTGANCNVSTCVNYCLNGGGCVADPLNGNSCICRNGFKGSRCELIDDPCESNPCLSERSECISRYYNHFECRCDFGYTGQFCEIKIDSCLKNPCVRGNCVTNSFGLTKCICPIGFTGRYCEVNLGVCEPMNPCLNGGKCQFSISYNVSVCPEGVTGQNCDILLDVCASNPCKSEFSTCIQNGLNSFECICPQFETGKFCETSINLCDPNPCPLNIKCQQISYTETKCVCPPGFTGAKCTERFDVCQSNPCLNGNCVSPLPGVFRCNCNKGYKGLFCQESIILCDYVTCLNGGYCLSNSSSNGFKCICPKGFTGLYCDIPIDPCQSIFSDPCGNNGKCMYVSPGEYICKCKGCFYGKSCQNSFDPCSASSSVCKNSGVCKLNSTNCSYKCECPPGFEGQNCEYNTNPCLSNPRPCLNGGTCVVNGTEGYRCQCDVNYSGNFCENYLNPCNKVNCSNGGVCIIDQHFNQATCLCQYGYTGLNCENKINFCLSAPCFNKGKCVNENTSFVCECENGFGGQYCQEQIDYCSLLNPCVNGNCFRGSPGNYSCFCFDGWTGKNCDLKISYCDSNPCVNGMCIDHIGGYTCKCSTGYTGFDCSTILDSCLSNPCLNGICLNVFNPISANAEYACFCDPGFSGVNCDTQIDLCLNNANCINNGTCKQLSNSFAYCDCPSGFEGQNCEIKSNPCGQVTCFNGGTCESLSPSTFKCSCLPGFSGTFCQNQKDLCQPNPCLNSGNCTSASGFYNCRCPSNYGGVNCQFSQKCDQNPCQNSALCTKLFDGSAKCTCQPGFTGLYCDRIINACDSNPCLNGASCYRYNYTGFFCSCSSGYRGATCNQDVDECQLNVCKNSGICSNTFGSFRCQCQAGFTGADCSNIILDSCMDNKCALNGTSRCVQTGFGSYACVCKDGYIGKYCDVKLIPCQSSPCFNNGNCIDSPDSLGFICNCPKGYFGNRCEFNSDYCSVYRPCGPYGSCRNLNGSNYECLCQPGITGKNCEVLINVCQSNPCLNLGTCISSINFYTCLCMPTHYGQNCEIPVDRCSEYPCYNGGTCIATFNSTICKCEIGFTGPQCQFVQNCVVQCKNGGLCDPSGTKCICLPNYNGTDCSNVISSCFFNPCKNGAACIDTNGTYTCQCPLGFNGRNCETQVSACDSNPCSQNGLCTSTNSISYKCTCFYPYSGINCENRLTLCDYVNCGQGICIPSSNDSFSATCKCNQGFTGQYCNLRILGCLSSPCQNGGQCVDVQNGTYACLCAPEYTGANCETKKQCVETYDYCSSLPCLNGGTCIRGTNCTFNCNCTNDYSGPYCQFSRKQSIFSSQQSIAIIQLNEMALDFKMELQPCLLQAWKESNPQFSCPSGYEMIPNIKDRCFLVGKVPNGLDKAKAEYECEVTGASLITFETFEKLQSIIKWLDSKSLTNVRYWTSSAVFRNGSTNESNWSWIWSSKLTNKIQPISYDNWGAFQQTNYNGDSLFLNSSDYRFYVELSRNNLTGFICESNVNGLSDSSISIIELNQTSVFTSLGQLAIKIDYLVNVTTNETTSVKNEITNPNTTFLKETIKNTCFKQVFFDSIDGRIYSLDSLFSIDICGDLLETHSEFIRKAILESWLTARPEFVWCSTQRNCMQVNILKKQVIYVDYWNKLTRVFYSVMVNDMLIDPSQSSNTPTSDIMRKNIEKIKKNFYSNYLLCGILIDSKTNESFIQSKEIQSQNFPLAVNNFEISSSIFTRSIIENAIKNAFYSSSHIDRTQLSISVTLVDDYQEVLVLSQFYRSIPMERFNINPSQITYPASLLSFRISIGSLNLSPATQGVVDENQFYFLIQQELYSNAQLRILSLSSFLLNDFQPFFKPDSHFLKIALTTNLIDLDSRKIESIIENFITKSKVEFKHCTNCWNDTYNMFSVRHIYTNVLIDKRANNYYELWFVVVVKNQYENNYLTIVELSQEDDFNTKYEQNKQAIYDEINTIKMSFNFGHKSYSVVRNLANTRSLLRAVKINLNQSILYEDVSSVVEMLKRSINLMPNAKTLNQNFDIDYWGQREYIKKISNSEYDTYWQAYFFIRSSNHSNLVFDSKFDFLVNTININYFFTWYTSARSNLFLNNIVYDHSTDYRTNNDLFYLSCFGSVSPDSYNSILSKLKDLWLSIYNHEEEQCIYQTLQLEFLSTSSISYVNLKGSYSVIPYIVRAFTDGRLLTSDLYKQPDLSLLKSALVNLCDVQDDVSKLYREDSLNYIEAIGTVTIDQAKQYLPSITYAYMSYFASMDQLYEPNVLINRPSEILSVETYIINMMIVTKIYYKINANTTFELNAYNYDIKNTIFKITSADFNSLLPILSRRITKNFARIDLLNRAKIQNINLILAWLPKFTIELEFGKELSLDQKLNIERTLVNYWNQTLNNLNKPARTIEVELAYSKGYYNIKDSTYSTLIYYIIAIDGLVKYETELPRQMSNQTLELSKELIKIGFKPNQLSSYVQIRSIYVDTNQRPVEFNIDLVQNILKESWKTYLNDAHFSLTSIESFSIIVKVIQQSLYYSKEKQLVGIKYSISINDLDPADYMLSDLPKYYIENKFSPFSIIANNSLLARRMYVYSSRLNDEKLIVNNGLMKDEISNLWRNKNILTNSLQQSQVAYQTEYYKAESRNFYSNFFDVSFYRITYTQSINGIEPTSLFYQSPKENDFDRAFLSDLGQNLMGFCFNDCFNYKQSGILIKKEYASNSSLLEQIKNTWIRINQVESKLANKIDIEISYITNKRSFKTIDTNTGLSVVLFNVKLNSKYTFNQLDSLDLKEPTKEDYLEEFSKLFEDISPKDLNPILDISVIKETKPFDWVISSTNKTTTQSNQIKDTVKTFYNNYKLDWWIWIIIVLVGLILIICVSFMTFYIIRKFTNKPTNSQTKRQLLKNDNESETSSQNGRDSDKFSAVTNPQNYYTDDLDENEQVDNIRSNLNLNQHEPIFTQTSSVLNRGKDFEKNIYPGMTLQDIVPNPIYTTQRIDCNEEDLITSVYVTGNIKTNQNKLEE